jgi:hypothetical protein
MLETMAGLPRDIGQNDRCGLQDRETDAADTLWASRLRFLTAAAWRVANGATNRYRKAAD